MKNVRRVLASLILALLLVSSWSASTRSKNAADRSNEQRGQRRAPAARATTTALAQKDLLAQPQVMNAEEKLVRDVYARLMRYQSAAIDEKAAKTGVLAATTDFLTYQLRNIHWGPISEIEQL